MNRVPCRKCAAPMIFARGAQGGKVPLDAVPDEELGDMILVADEEGLVRAVHVSKLEELASMFGPTLEELEAAPRYVSHFATCPHADEFRGDR